MADDASQHAEMRRAAMAPYLDGSSDDAVGVEAFVEHHSEFHTVMGSLTNNRVRMLTMQVYGKIVSHHVAIVNDPRQLRDVIADDHLQIAQAIAAGHHNRARDLMVAHIRAVADFNSDRLGPRVDDYIEWL